MLVIENNWISPIMRKVTALRCTGVGVTCIAAITFLSAPSVIQGDDSCQHFDDPEFALPEMQALIQSKRFTKQSQANTPAVVLPDASAGVAGTLFSSSELISPAAAAGIPAPAPQPIPAVASIAPPAPQPIPSAASIPPPAPQPIPAVASIPPPAPQPPVKALLPASNCPSDPWIDDLVRADPDGDGKVFVDVGCNTGSDAVMWLERWGRIAGVARKWDEGLKKNGVAVGACGQNVFHEVSHLALNKSNSSQGGPKVVCVEPMPSTAKLLLNLKAQFLGKDELFEVVQAVASDQITNQTVLFPDQKVGTEDSGIDHLGGGARNGNAVPQVPVVQVTVDGLIAQRGFKTVDVLTVDTEGHDPTVLKGAENALRNGTVRLLVFEVHQDLTNTVWAKTPLHVVLQQLGSWQYDCYFSGNDGKLHRLSGVWNADMESKYHPLMWSNVACVRKADTWHTVLEKYSVDL